MEIISITGIFEDPLCAELYPKCKGPNDPESQEEINKRCNPWDTPFLLDRAYLVDLFNLAWETLPRLRQVAGGDIVNDDKDNTRGDINPKI